MTEEKLMKKYKVTSPEREPFTFDFFIDKNSPVGYVMPRKDHVTLSDNALYLYQVFYQGFQSYGAEQ